jgi:hypothetical protein
MASTESASLAERWPHGFATYEGECPACGTPHHITIGHPGPHTWIASSSRTVGCMALGRINCARARVELLKVNDVRR